MTPEPSAAGEPKNEEAALEAPPPLLVSTSPHIRSPESIPRIMWTVNLALLPALACGVAVFGPRALWVSALAVATALATEALCQKLRKRPITITDGSAFLTGLLVAFVLVVFVLVVLVLVAFVPLFVLAEVRAIFFGLVVEVSVVVVSFVGHVEVLEASVSRYGPRRWTPRVRAAPLSSLAPLS